jgi:hypothetical protein
MKNKLAKKILLGTTSVVLFLAIVLSIHIYIVTRPKVDASTKVMARIDLKQDISQADANKIAAWMYQQKGIDHVLVNPQNDIVIFTFYPLKTTTSQVVSDFKSTFNYTKAARFMPSEDQLKGSCPVASTSITYKVYNFFKQTF